jgi:FtsP/CotA-like multicopper oxidase with cupredoxin domain
MKNKLEIKEHVFRYIRMRFRAQNPGVWLLHCHTEPHLDRGMAVVFHVSH